MLRNEIAPAVTLYHWDLPQALEDRGGWLNRDTAKYFRDYAMVVFEQLGDVAASWITLNEPWCSAFLGYGIGEHAPGKADIPSHYIAAHHLLLGHGLALQGYRQMNLPADIGITLNLTPQYPASSRPADVAAARKADGFQNRWYLDPIFKGAYPEDMDEALSCVSPAVKEGDLELISMPNDFLGINFYSRAIVSADEQGQPQTENPEFEVTAMGWEVCPEALYDLLVRVHSDYGPIPLYITENGAAYEDELENGRIKDTKRQAYLEQHIAQSARAIEAGVPLKGYYVWSLLDNFEWAYGYERRFGIVYVNFETQERILKDSARWYRSFCRSNLVRTASQPFSLAWFMTL